MFSFKEIFGTKLFNDSVMKSRLSPTTYEALRKIRNEAMIWDPAVAEEVADAIKKWALEQGATHFVHWFSPLTGTNSGRHDSFLDGTNSDGAPIVNFSAKLLTSGESDASSFPSGGLRSTFEARGYTVWDATSPCFVMGTTLYIPTAFCSFTGEALDQKTPLLRSTQAVSKQTLRVLHLLGYTDIKSVKPTMGAEQEYFLVDKNFFDKRLDLKITGRTIFGAMPPKGQEMGDHYYGSTKERVREYMREVDLRLWELGVPSKTEHNEVAPGQFEVACVYSEANISCDHNQIVMDVLRKVALNHNLACLLYEKPFVGINGSGKHNNYSLSTDTSKNLLNPGSKPEENIIFLLTLAAFIRGVDEHADLLRLAAATSGNDFRLGAHEAPPAIISIYLGDYLQGIMEKIAHGDTHSAETETKRSVLLGAKALPLLTTDENDRNRTSPFAFTGSKFEFRMVGSSQPLGFVNSIINAMVAVSMRDFAHELELAEDKNKRAYELVAEIYKNHKRIIFNGNGYSKEWVKEAKTRGLPNINCTIDAIPAIIKPENIAFLAKAKTFSESECFARYEIMYDNYIKTINVELKTAVEMLDRIIVPAAIEYCGKLAKSCYYCREYGTISKTAVKSQCNITTILDDIADLSQQLKEEHCAALSVEAIEKRAMAIYQVCTNTLSKLRAKVDCLEKLMPKNAWPMPDYTDLLFYL